MTVLLAPGSGLTADDGHRLSIVAWGPEAVVKRFHAHYQPDNPASFFNEPEESNSWWVLTSHDNRRFEPRPYSAMGPGRLDPAPATTDWWCALYVTPDIGREFQSRNFIGDIASRGMHGLVVRLRNEDDGSVPSPTWADVDDAMTDTYGPGILESVRASGELLLDGVKNAVENAGDGLQGAGRVGNFLSNPVVMWTGLAVVVLIAGSYAVRSVT
jgi:hypothetical protein